MDGKKGYSPNANDLMEKKKELSINNHPRGIREQFETEVACLFLEERGGVHILRSP